MDTTVIYTIIGSSLTVILSMFGMFLWIRGEASQDRRHFEATISEDRRQSDAKIEHNVASLRNVIDENARETRSLIEAIRQDMRDFHGRLCALEGRWLNLARSDKKPECF